MENIRIDEQKLQGINRGFNFVNFKQTERKYFIEVLLKTSVNLKRKEEVLEVRDDLGNSYSYHYGQDIIDFLERLNEFVKKPLVKIRHFNRKDEVSIWGMKDKFRNKTIKFSDVEISIGELAEEKLKKMDMDFNKEVKDILDLQEKSDEKIQNLVDKFIILKEKMLTLDSCLGNEKRNEYYGYNEKKDRTTRMVLLTPQQYNEKLKEIETEMRKISAELGMELVGEYDFKYIPIPKKMGFDEWLKASKDDLKENWGIFDDDERKEYKNFKEYAEMIYDECNGEIVEQGGYNDGYGMEQDEDEEFDE